MNATESCKDWWCKYVPSTQQTLCKFELLTTRGCCLQHVMWWSAMKRLLKHWCTHLTQSQHSLQQQTRSLLLFCIKVAYNRKLLLATWWCQLQLVIAENVRFKCWSGHITSALAYSEKSLYFLHCCIQQEVVAYIMMLCLTTKCCWECYALIWH